MALATLSCMSVCAVSAAAAPLTSVKSGSLVAHRIPKSPGLPSVQQLTGQLWRVTTCNDVALVATPGRGPTYRAIQFRNAPPRTPCGQIISWQRVSVVMVQTTAQSITVIASNGTFTVPIH